MDSNVNYVPIDTRKDATQTPSEGVPHQYGQPAQQVVWMPVGFNNFQFQDLLCFLVAGLLCCPWCPVISWASLYVNNDALNSYHKGQYEIAVTKQRRAKILCGVQLVIGLLIWIIVVVIAARNNTNPLDVED